MPRGSLFGVFLGKVLKNRVVITGIGILSPLGNSPREFWDNSITGKIGYGKLNNFDKLPMKSRVVGKIPDFEYRGITSNIYQRNAMGRPSILSVNASIRAIEDAGIDANTINQERAGVCVANAIADTPYSETEFLRLTNECSENIDPKKIDVAMYRKGMFSFIAFDVANQFGFQGESFVMSTGCTGGIDAVGYGFESIANGDHDLMICGAAEAPITYMTIASFDAIGALSTSFNNCPHKASRPFDLKRDGFVLSEGCSMLVLEDLEKALMRKAKIYAEIVNFSSSNNAFHMTNLPQNGDALGDLMSLSLAKALLNPSDIDYVNAHGSSTPQNDAFETAAYKKTFREYAYTLPISSTKSMVGHPLSAASAIEIAHCLMTLNNNIAPPTMNQEYDDPECDLNYVPNHPLNKDLSAVLTNASGFSGIHSVMILKKYRP